VPFYDTVAFDEVGRQIDGGSQLTFVPVRPKELTPKNSTITWTIPIIAADDRNSDGVSISFELKTRIDSYSQAVKLGKEAVPFGGYVAFFPVPATAKNSV
jgi:hypothetical protein